MNQHDADQQGIEHLVSALTAYVLEVRAWMASSPPEETFPLPREGWFADGPWAGSITRRVWRQTYPRFPAPDELASLASAHEAIENDPVLGPLIGKKVGSTRLGSELLLSTDNVLGLAFEVSGDATQGDEIAALLRPALTRFCEFVAAPTRRAHILVPINHLRLAAPFELEPGIVFDAFTTSELIALASFRTIQPDFAGDPVIRGGQWSGIRISHELPRTLHEADDEFGDMNSSFSLQASQAFGSPTPSRMYGIIDDLLVALRLSHPEFIGTSGAAYASEVWNGLETRQGFNRQTRLMDWAEQDLGLEQQARLREVWRLLKANMNADRSLPELVLSRFSTAVDRGGQDDRIMDLVIALEALLLHGVRDELKFRAALRGALVLENAGYNRRRAFEVLSAAYDLRSQIAHGSAPASGVKVGRRTQVPVHELVQEVENLVRALIVQALRECVDEGVTFGTNTYWNDLTLGQAEAEANATEETPQR